MTEHNADTSEDFEGGLTHEHAIMFHRAFIAKFFELLLKEIDDDLAKLPGLELFDQIALRAKWTKGIDLMGAAWNALDKYETDEGKLDLVAQVFGDQLQLPAHSLALDIKQRLDWYKQRAAENYARTIKNDVTMHGITSPIEQLFLMEWRCHDADSKHGVKLRPQHQLTLDGRPYRIDFVVDVPDGRQIAIELDGHDFHERTKKQAAQDRARERKIIREGYIILRFTGAEVHHNPRTCVEEVIDLITRPPR